MAQKSETIKNMFVRVYDLEGNKIAKGRIAFINDSVIGLKRSSKVYQSFFMRNIGLIKTKKSGGHNVFKGALIGAGLGLVHGLANRESDDEVGMLSFSFSKSDYVIMDVTAGASLGAVAGGISTIFKNSDIFIINGDLDQWQLFKAFVINGI
ncbi:hypothetical protein GCM10007028_13520 [Algibacter mikhailovii]|uniref:Uncharacterized protein n=2 Tax=Algibacter mikhailovii TaxID=425498 RepID=A0A918QX63_9FLAO|nr:hypothetical protein GCM10007028_13520 [Algibacter mikhailovii]